MRGQEKSVSVEVTSIHVSLLCNLLMINLLNCFVKIFIYLHYSEEMYSDISMFVCVCTPMCLCVCVCCSKV